ncbi:MAG: hypothetical protein RL260_601, partial [Pseudomonadota bacterium]
MTYRPRPTPVSIRPTGQRGVTLLGLVFWAVVISVAALVAMRIL